MTASKLYHNDEGNYNCYFCSSECSNNILVSSFLKKTFTNYNLILNPDSLYMCRGCYYSMTDKSIKELIMPDGEKKYNQSVRTYSWYLTKNEKIVFSKKHIQKLKYYILYPSDIPFSIIISDSGKKHLIFRAPVSYNKDNYFLQFEEEKVYINIKQLEDRIRLCEKIIAFCGKKRLLKYNEYKISKLCLMNIEDSTLDKFFSVRKEKLTELAVFLSRNKEECLNENTNKMR
jgi:CRISPR type IV-associated protein Csf1